MSQENYIDQYFKSAKLQKDKKFKKIDSKVLTKK